MKKSIIVAVVVILWILLSILYFNSSKEEGNLQVSNQGQMSTESTSIKIIENNRDLGEIPMDEWKVEIPFEFTNIGNSRIRLWNGETSCMCTEWYVIDGKGKKSAIIKMRWHASFITNVNMVIEPWETIKLIAIYDPNSHGPNATWPISRNIYINTDSKTTPKLNFRFMGNVVKTRSVSKLEELKNQETKGISWKQEIFDFSEDSFDFWTIKQSWGKVQHDFNFTYNGEETIKITWVPTSCACTSAVLNKTEFQPWDTWILTVTFNPNLHGEPDGKFFKTVTLLTDKKLENIPEIKIWTEIDLDLWEEAFELQTVHDDDHKDNHESNSGEKALYHSITPEELSTMMKNKDFTLVDTHIPEQERIEGTDIFIPYNEIIDNLDMLPSDKNAKIVLYCRSGGMSRAAAYLLTEKWYTNVYDLVGWKNAYDAFLEKK